MKSDDDGFSFSLSDYEEPTPVAKAEAEAEAEAEREAGYQALLAAELAEMDSGGLAKIFDALPEAPRETVPAATPEPISNGAVQVLDDNGNWVDAQHLAEVDKAVERLRVQREARAVFAVEVGAFGVFDASKAVDINELSSQPATNYLIEGILERAAISMLFADGYVGKSFLVLYWAMCIATGIDWEGHQAQTGRVLFVALEGHSTFPKRLAALRARYGGTIPKDALMVYPATVNLLDPTSVTALANFVATGHFDMIVIDTLNRAIAGGDENSTEQMGAFISALAQVREAHEPSHIVVLHHSKKDDVEKYRGASVLFDGFDNVLCLRRVKLGDDAVSKADPHRRLIFQKVKSGQPPAVMALVFEQVPNTGSAVLVRDNLAGVDPIIRHLITMQTSRGPGGAAVTRAELKKHITEVVPYKDAKSANARIGALISTGLLTHSKASDEIAPATLGKRS